MLVKNVMVRAVKSVHPDTLVQEVASLMCLQRFSSLPVTENGDELVGVIAERDILRHPFPSLQDLIAGGIGSIDFEALEKDYKNTLPLRARELMHTPVIAVSPDIPILKAVSIMAKHNFRRIPVADGSKLVGIISLGDIHRAIFMESFSNG